MIYCYLPTPNQCRPIDPMQLLELKYDFSYFVYFRKSSLWPLSKKIPRKKEG